MEKEFAQTAMDAEGNIVDADEVESLFTETHFSGWDLVAERLELGNCVAARVVCDVKDIGEKTGKGGERTFYQKLKVREVEDLVVVPKINGEED